MTRDALVTQLAAIERVLNTRIIFTRIVEDEDGREISRTSTTRRRTSADDVSITFIRQLVRPTEED